MAATPEGFPEVLHAPRFAAALLAEVVCLRQRVAEQEAELAESRARSSEVEEELSQVRQSNQKLEAAVTHRDGVIAQLAASRKVVFDDAHRWCADADSEVQQLQGALVKAARQLSQERREYRARCSVLRSQVKQLRAAKQACGWDADAAGALAAIDAACRDDSESATSVLLPSPFSASTELADGRIEARDNTLALREVVDCARPEHSLEAENARLQTSLDGTHDDVDYCAW